MRDQEGGPKTYASYKWWLKNGGVDRDGFLDSWRPKPYDRRPLELRNYRSDRPCAQVTFKNLINVNLDYTKCTLVMKINKKSIYYKLYCFTAQIVTTSGDCERLNKDDLIKLANELDKENNDKNKEIASLHIELELQKNENQGLREELNDIRGQLNEIKNMIQTQKKQDFDARLVEVERRLYSQEQYSRRECIELHGFEAVENENVEDAAIAVLNATADGGKVYKKSDFHAIHKLKDNNVVIMKSVNRRTVLNALRSRKKLKDLTDGQKNSLREKKVGHKIYINESLCPYYRGLFGKCNALFKKKLVKSFYTINGTIRIIDSNDNKLVIGHIHDLESHFGKKVIDSIKLQNKRHLNKDDLIKLANELDKENNDKNKEIASLHIELELQKNENQGLREELNDIRGQLNEIKNMIQTQKKQDFDARLVEVERRLYSQEQYSRRECIELHGFEAVENENVEDAAIAVLNATADGGKVYKKSDFHAIRKLKDNNVVIMKSVNRRTVLNALRSRKKLKDLTDGQKNSLREKKVGHKIYINESLCPYYRGLFGKCNALFKKKLVKSFYTINGTIRIIDSNDNKLVIGHIHDLESHFGKKVIDSIKLQNKRHLNKDDLIKLANELDKENNDKNKEIASLHIELELQKNENQGLREELNDIRGQLNEIKNMIQTQKKQDFDARLVEVERRLYSQEQYSRRECIELHGFEAVENENVEDAAIAVLNATADGGKVYKKSDFHAIHKLKDNNVVIMKSVNRRTVLNALRSRKKLKDLTDGQKNSLREKKVGHKIYINESLCPYYRGLFGKCNALFKKKLVKSFYTINGTIRIIDSNDNKLVIGHIHDLESHFGKKVIDSIKLQNKRHLNKDDLIKLANELDKENNDKNKEIASLHIELELQKNENQGLREELNDIRGQLNEIKNMIQTQKKQDFDARLVEVERRLYSQEQYSRRECIELHGFEAVENENVEDAAIAVLNATADGGKVYKKSDFHAIHKLKDNNVVIMKSVNRRTVLNALRSRKKLKDLTDGQKNSLREKKVGHKIYINESLCPYYRGLFGKCNALFKKKLVKSFYTINGTIRIIDSNDNKLVIGHIHDLESHFGKKVIDSIKLQNKRQ
ncbi:putative leucine-rich repeat-containing protein DDB_G0290503 [Clytia hemisphaerica]|uniref:putative leucine-rich repeat-containing protein DDB_G0290503 n=1 Tax=Clytia hemisphaerica TaxID=252671 RepID=UPI0034D7B32A